MGIYVVHCTSSIVMCVCIVIVCIMHKMSLGLGQCYKLIRTIHIVARQNGGRAMNTLSPECTTRARTVHILVMT